jgi:hypothetical protein
MHDKLRPAARLHNMMITAEHGSAQAACSASLNQLLNRKWCLSKQQRQQQQQAEACLGFC